ncbi:ATPase domain-containing protein [Nitrosarchaeum sp. AC2]|uniref:ATPase domain-containing protein n=1 Tax=Nitrosarchaeum sp. AC2 TaxID=2259673 RepID=UPI0015CE4005|nr:ATPase domain-containing protein [Nitrosarchaeum sp. AC2]QLH11770.1 recombinase RecA [Nitrosarchaeum sp. AC2]
MISTGLQKLDDFLSGGIPKGVITDIYGGSGTGKTQLLFQICINAIKNGGNVLYQDTTGSFRPERILEIQKQQNLTFDILEKITVSRITNTSEQLKSIEVMNNSNFSLIVIDNITDLFSYEYPKDDTIFEKNSIFFKYIHNLSLVAINKKIPVVITNMIRNIEGIEMENMRTAIDPLTHIKIKLTKTSKFYGEIRWLLHQTQFSYKILPAGLSDYPEDI